MGLLSNLFNRQPTINQEPYNWDWFKKMGFLYPKYMDHNANAYINEGYESNIDVFSIITKIVKVSTSIPWIVEQQRGDEWEEIEDTSIHELLNNPNPLKNYTWDDIQEMYLVYLLVTGNSYMVGEELSGRYQSLDVLPSQNVTIQAKENFFMPDPVYKFGLGTSNATFEKNELQHIRFFNPGYNSNTDGLLGLSMIQVASRAVKVGNDRWDADAVLLENKGAIGILTDRSNRPMSPAEAQQAQSEIQKRIGGTRNFGKTVLINKDLNYISLAMSSADLQLIEKGVVTLRSICNVFGLDSSLFNDPANKTFNNRLEAEKAMYTNVIIPLSNKVAQAHTQYIVKNHFPGKQVRMRQDFSKVEALQKDKQAEAQKDKTEMEGINIVLNMPISNEGKKELLISKYNFTEDEVNIIVQDNEAI